MRKIFQVVILLPVAALLIALSVANRAPVAVTLDPLTPGNPALTITLPLFAWLLAAIIAGALIGGALTWMAQGRHRAKARAETSRANAVAREAEALKAERAAALAQAASRPLSEAAGLPAPR
jgi:uncharacterized integral membrane protein